MNCQRAHIIAILFIFLFANTASVKALKTASPEILTQVNRITIPFMKNRGQIKDSGILYYSNTFACKVLVNKDGSISYGPIKNENGKVTSNYVVREKLVNALDFSPQGEQKAIAKVSHFIGKNPKDWLKDIFTFNLINMGEVYKGVQLKLQAHGNNVEKFFYINPKIDPQNIRLRIDGAQNLNVNSKGELEISTESKVMRFSKPKAYQKVNGKKYR